MSAVPKILIKPRSSAADAPSASEEPEEPYPDADVEDEGDGEGDDEPTDAPTPMEVDDDAPEGSIPPPMPVKRGRGRPRGSGRGRILSGPPPAPRPRGRPRGSTRGPGRPRGSGLGRQINGGLTIRLPKRDDESDDFGGEGGGATSDGEVPVEKEGPIAGGKPFRRIGGDVYVIEGDEFVTEVDPKGETKIDQWGNLLGDRRFKASTFILPTRHPERKYMLAIDAARTSGFRDSLYYFRRNALALKHVGTQAEKDYLISIGKLGPHLRTRSVTLVTARSAFKLHGAKTIFEGRWVVDDYYEDRVLAEITEKGLKAGDPVGDLPDPNAHKAEKEAADPGKNERIAGGAQGIYRAGGPTTLFAGSGIGPFSDGPLNVVRKSLFTREGVTEENWMWMKAMRTLQDGAEWARLRKESVQPVDRSANNFPVQVEGGPDYATYMPMGAYEAQAGQMLYRADTQPTQHRIEAAEDSGAKMVLGGTKSGNGAWGILWWDTVMESKPTKEEQKREAAEKMRLWKEARASDKAAAATAAATSAQTPAP
ncbi:hypothetical protein MKEN_00239300 [Mycena kentingensis (nom. inval.)]|nr:hypothetical protein MKEN_00239300 [Mycena kentingensis (nom. inval.)]